MKVIDKVDKKITGRQREWLVFSKILTSSTLWSPIRKHSRKPSLQWREGPEWVEKIKTKAKTKGLLLGERYGSIKKEIFRIANFPAL